MIKNVNIKFKEESELKERNVRLRKLLYRLNARKVRGDKFFFKKLSPEQVKFISEYYPVEEYLFKINTRRFEFVGKLPELLKEIHFLSKRKKKTTIKRLNKEEQKLLKRNGVVFHVYMHRIWLK